MDLLACPLETSERIVVLACYMLWKESHDFKESKRGGFLLDVFLLSNAENNQL